MEKNFSLTQVYILVYILYGIISTRNRVSVKDSENLTMLRIINYFSNN